MALSIVVAISLILSIILWSNPAYEHSKRNNSSNSTSRVVNKSLSYTYLPTQAIHTDRHRHQWIIADPNANIVSEFVKRLGSGRRMTVIRSHSTANYFRYLNRPRSVILSYQNDATTPIMNSVAGGGFSRLPDRRFNRIVLPLNRSRYFYLLRDQNHQVYRVMLRRSLNNLKAILAKRLRKIPVQLRANYGRPVVNYPKGVSMPQYEYLVNKQTRNYYVMHLLSGNHNIVRTRRRNRTSYSDESNRQLIFGKYRNVTYINDRPRHVKGNFNQSLYNSYHNLSILNLPLTGVHYFAYQPRTRTILYRGFVEGFPIFNPTQFGIVSMQYRNGELRYNYSLNSLQIPIPNERKKLRLPDTHQVLANLKAQGYKLRNVQSIEIGYEWQNAKSSKLLANLIPDWFIKYNGRWLNYDQLIKSGV